MISVNNEFSKNLSIQNIIDEKSFNNSGKEKFRWVFLPDEISKDNTFGFGNYKKDLLKFLTDIEYKIYNKFKDLTWEDVDKKSNCGAYQSASLSSKQKEKLPIDIGDSQFYHIAISNNHRLFGYRDDNIFHIMLNDPNHNFDKL